MRSKDEMSTFSQQTEIATRPEVESWCKTRVGNDKLSYIFSISDFSSRFQQEREAIESCIFFSSNENDIIQWRVRVYGNVKDHENQNYMGLYLKRVSTSKTEVQARYAFWIVDDKGDVKYEKMSSVTTFGQDKSWGYKQFIERDFLLDKANGLLKDDRLTIGCRVFVDNIITSQTIAIKLKIPESHLSHDFGKLFESHMFSDVILSVKGHNFHAHKSILSARSPVFAAMFDHRMKEAIENKVYITDLNYETVEQMLYYVYTGKVPCVEEIATELLAAASKYDIDWLTDTCISLLYLKLSNNNASDILILADKYNANELKACVLNFIAVHGADVMNTSGWKTLELLHPHLITEICMASADLVTKVYCHNNMNTAKSYYTWVIDKFSLCMGKKIRSSIFSSDVADKHMWRLKLYPTVSGKENASYVSLKVKFMSCSENKVHARFKLLILNAFLKTVHDVDGTNAFDEENPGWCVDEFVERKFLLNESNGLLADDRLILRCDISVLSDTIAISSGDPNFRFDVPTSHLSDDFEKLLENQKFSDVTLSVNGHELYVHKNVLSARSSVFAAMFEHDMEEAKHNIVEITDVNYEVLKEMLRFLYTGNAPNLEKMAAELLAAANKYVLDRLKVMCEAALSSNLCIDNACDLLVLADKHNADQLKASVIAFMILHARDVVHTNNWKTIEKHHVHLVSEVCKALITMYPEDTE